MKNPFTRKKLTDVEDSAPKHGLGEVQEARFATADLEAERTGISHMTVKAGKRQGIAHKHDEAEEIYVVVAGAGRVKLDDEIVEIAYMDAIRVAPSVTRQFEAAAEEDLVVIAVGARHEGDGEVYTDFWQD